MLSMCWRVKLLGEGEGERDSKVNRCKGESERKESMQVW